MKRKLFLLAALLVLPGCYPMFAAKTVATYEDPEGKRISYSSDKELTGLNVDISTGPDGKERLP